MSAEVILCVCAAIIIVENATLVLVVTLHRSLHNHTNFFVLSMAISDFLVGAAFIPTYLYVMDSVILGAITSCVMFSNVSNIALLTTDRFLASIKGMNYQIYMKKYYRYMIIIAWLIAAVITIVPFFWSANTSSTYHFVFLFIVQALVFLVYVYIIAVYSYILHLARTILWRRKDKKPNTTRNSQIGTNREIKLCSPRWTKAECKITKIFSGVCILFCLTWFPMIFLTTCTLLKREDLIFQQLPDLAMYMTSLSSIVNPWIYAITKNDFRGVLRMFILGVWEAFSRCQRENPCSSNNYIDSTDSEPHNEDEHRL